MSQKPNYTKINSKMWDEWASAGGEWSLAINHQDFVDATQGVFDIYLTPCKPVPHNWFIPFKKAKILGLASGEDSNAQSLQHSMQKLQCLTTRINN